ncbi:MAG: type II secretion system F family protein [Candidatus Aenigmatarchaeota archaeon]
MKINLTTEQKIVLISSTITIFLISIGIFSADETTRFGVISNAFILFAFMLILPFIFLKYQRERALREMEEKMPLFLRDLVENLRSGIPLHQAILHCSKLDYGELSKQLKKIGNQISWNMPLNKVLDQFEKRVSKSRKLSIALRILKESYFTGGDIISTLSSLVDNLTELNEVEKERMSVTNQYVVLIYAVAFIFVAILVVINRLMLPIFQSPGIEAMGLVNPCSDSYDLICEIFNLPSKYIFAVKDSRSIGSYYLSIFFYMSTIIAISCGLVVGEIRERSLLAGLKHSLILTMACWGILLLLKVLNLLGV